ncbi:pseudouridine synthase [Leptothrix sp. BB-4]
MVTLKLKKSPDAGLPSKNTSPSPSDGPRRSPVRGLAAARQRPTLAQAQAERAQREEAFRQRGETAQGSFGTPRQDPRQDTRQDFRQDPRPAPPRDGRREDPRRDPRFDNRQDPRAPQRGEPRPGPRQDDRRSGPAPEPRRWPDRGPGPGFGRDTPAPQARRDERGDHPQRPFVKPSERLRARPVEQATDVPTQPLRQDGERLSKRMTALGLASRREADTWIEAGWVRVDGQMAVLGQRVGPDARIEIDPAAHQQQAQRVTILLNKPIGYVSGQAEDGHEPAVVLIKPGNQWAEDKSGQRWHPGHLRGLAPAGRLDIDSVGLLVLTQDGRVARQLIGEDSTIEKEYLVRVVKEGGGQLSDQALALLNHGLELDGHKLKPAKVSWANEDQLRFVLREGRKRQIRRMCELVGLTVVGLKRVRIGSVVLGHLPPGQWRYLRREEFFG